MGKAGQARVAIVDYGLGNLFSVKHACAHVGMHATITSSKEEVLQADAVILPGVGAFGDAMGALIRLDLVSPLREIAQSGKPIMGICLGLQLLMTESYEFGRHRGLGIVEGPVVPFKEPMGERGRLKVPQVGWNPMYRVETSDDDPWAGSLLKSLPNGVFMYFVHSFYVQPADLSVIIATTRYGNIEFCSALQYRNVFACQCHPERSGPHGLRVYRNLATWLQKDPLL